MDGQPLGALTLIILAHRVVVGTPVTGRPRTDPSVRNQHPGPLPRRSDGKSLAPLGHND